MRIAFVMEIGLGHTTFYKNLRKVVENHTDIEPTWIEITFENPGPIFRLPKLRNDIVLRAGVQTYQKLLKACRQQPFDALYFHTQLPAVLSGSFMRRIPAVINIDSTPKQFLALGHYGLVNNPRSYLQRRNDRLFTSAFRNSAAIFSWSQWAADSTVKDYGIPADRARVFYPGTDLDFWKPSPQRERASVNLLFVGGDFYRKGGDLLVRWARENQTSAVPWEMHLVTRDPVEAPPPNVFIYHGLTSNAPELIRLYQQADVFVLPTRADCYSLVALEAMATGLPVVISRQGGIPEIVEEGKTGYLIDVDDFNALSERLHRLMTNPTDRRAMGQAARSAAVERFEGTKNFLAELEALKQVARAAR